ncbi:hypothetical protein CC2G_011623 [Coprinopsis cinerea AmutBmut pab1-1]|nr:hypothetical protein CC2G_011623 [Coprinopsis cinerea AmutBmut pab1-1]
MRRGEKDDPHCLDENLLLRDTTNVYVCDLSLFPFSPEVNPTLTLVALALRLSRQILSPKIIDTKGNDEPGSYLTVARAQVRRWVVNQTGDPIKVQISNISGVALGNKFIDEKPEPEAANAETILEPGEVLEVDRDSKTDETVRVYRLMFGVDWEEWKKMTNRTPEDPFLTRPDHYIASPQKVCAIL